MSLDMNDFTPGVPYDVHTTAVLLSKTPGVTPIIAGAELGDDFTNAPYIKLYSVDSNGVVKNRIDADIAVEIDFYLQNYQLSDTPIVSVINADNNTSHKSQHYLGVVLRKNPNGAAELVVIDPLGREGATNPSYRKAANLIIDGFRRKFAQDIEVTINPEGTIYQRDSVSCSPVCLANVEAIAKGEFINTNQFGITKTPDGIPQFPPNAALLRNHQQEQYLGAQARDIKLTPSAPAPQRPIPQLNLFDSSKKALAEAEKAFQDAKDFTDSIGEAAKEDQSLIANLRASEAAVLAANTKLIEAEKRHIVQLDIKTKQEAFDKATAAQKLAEKEMSVAILKPGLLPEEERQQYLSSLRVTAAQTTLDVAHANMALQESLEKALSTKLQDLLNKGSNQEQIEPIFAQQALIAKSIKDAEIAVVSTYERLNKEITSAQQTFDQLTQQHKQEIRPMTQSGNNSSQAPNPGILEDETHATFLGKDNDSAIKKYLLSGTPKEVAEHLDRAMQKYGFNETTDFKADQGSHLYFDGEILDRVQEVGKELEKRAVQRGSSFGRFMQKIGDYASIVMNAFNFLSSKKVDDPKLAAACSEFKNAKGVIEVGLTRKEKGSDIHTFAARIRQEHQNNNNTMSR